MRNSERFEVLGYIGIYPITLELAKDLIHCKGQVLSSKSLISAYNSGIDRIELKTEAGEDILFSKLNSGYINIGCLTFTCEKWNEIYNSFKIVKKNKK